MLRLDQEQHQRAVSLVARAVFSAGWTTPEQSQRIAMEAVATLAEDFDVSPMDMGERNQMDDVVSGNVWPEASVSGSVNLPIPEPSDQSGYVARSLEQRAIDAALAKSPRPTSWTKIL